MFAVYCPHHRHRVLLPESHILALEPAPRGLRIRARCWCGTVCTTDPRVTAVMA
jgi:hypothetical protein